MEMPHAFCLHENFVSSTNFILIVAAFYFSAFIKISSCRTILYFCFILKVLLHHAQMLDGQQSLLHYLKVPPPASSGHTYIDHTINDVWVPERPIPQFWTTPYNMYRTIWCQGFTRMLICKSWALNPCTIYLVWFRFCCSCCCCCWATSEVLRDLQGHPVAFKRHDRNTTWAMLCYP